MTKDELEKIASKAELVKYEESKEYKSILEACEKRDEESREKVREMYHKNIEKEHKHDFHDKTNSWIEFLRDRLLDIKSDSKGAEALRKEITGEIIFNDKMITGKVMDQYNNVYSAVLLNNYDMERLNGTNNRIFPQVLNGLINSFGSEETKEEEIY